MPSTLIIKSGANSVSNQLSLAGLSNICPTHWAEINGWTFSILVPYGWLTRVTLV